MANYPTSLNTPYLFLTGVVVISVVSLFVILQPMMDDANALKHEIAENSASLADKQNFLNSLDMKIQQLQALADVENQMATVLPETDRTQDVIRVLNEYATQAGVTILGIANNSATSVAEVNADRARGEVISIPDGVRTLVFEVNATGAYEQVRLFLTLLGKSPRVIDVAGLSLKQISTQPGNITATIELHLYSQQPALETGV